MGVWTSCLRKTSSLSLVLAKSNVSYLNLSKLLRCSQVMLENLSPWNKQFLDSPRSLPANTITCLRSPFTWLAISRRSLLRPNDWLPKLPPKSQQVKQQSNAVHLKTNMSHLQAIYLPSSYTQCFFQYQNYIAPAKSANPRDARQSLRE